MCVDWPAFIFSFFDRAAVVVVDAALFPIPLPRFSTLSLTSPTMATPPPQLQQQYDLTARMAPFLDRHLLFPLLEFASARGLYDDASIQDAKVALLAQTNMVDYAADVWRAARGTEPPAEFAAKREEVVAKLKSLQVR